MTLLLSDTQLPLLVKLTLAEHTSLKTLPWNNLDQLSSLWGVFTKYKKNIRDGLRLENLSWRLWYRQSIMQKTAEPKTSEDIVFPTSEQPTKRLTRTRSMPDIWSHKSLEKTTTTATNKFYIDEKPLGGIPVKKEASLPLPQKEEQLTFTKKKPLRRTTTTTHSALSKPVSLLSDMLQRTESNVSLVKSSGLRRCQSRYCRLDQFFMNTAA